jgi:hypothetical protein
VLTDSAPLVVLFVPLGSSVNTEGRKMSVFDIIVKYIISKCCAFRVFELQIKRH